MSLEDALRRYRGNLFTDSDITGGTGLTVRAWRELIKIGAVRTVTVGRGPGRVRLCDTTTFKRTAIIAALNKAGWSLAMAGRMAYLLPKDQLLYLIWDPITALFESDADVDPDTGLPPRLKRPRADWFDPDKPATAYPKEDWRIEIYEGRFVAVIYGADNEREPITYGDLRNEGTRFVAWFPFHKEYRTKSQEVVDVLVSKWQHSFALLDRPDPKFLDYKYENHDADDDPLRIAAQATARSPLFKTSINISLAVRKALRRYLGIEPTTFGSETVEPHDAQ